MSATSRISSALVLALALGAAGVVAAQTPPPMGPGEGKPSEERKLTPLAGTTQRNAPMPTAAATGQMPVPNPAMEGLKWFVGTWACKGHVPQSPMGPAHATNANVRIASDLGGFWIVARYDEAKTRENPGPMHIQAVWGYDEKRKSLDATSFDGYGGSSKQQSQGWQGDTLVWTGEGLMAGEQTGMRDTFTKKGDDEVTHKGEAQMNGTWTVLDEESCNRVRAKK